ncbi:hypothetical protein BJ322DRAFT_160495 [Thelephora terrestris]|uniref:Uncharacterized protein n=1 Tax=Thelephora terrestris TaxID=56493 RepID=A0A9P6L513_9AGAM|nr:hypothetical protein BJ322DRAFT_160495 [Thelephora terrestris]
MEAHERLEVEDEDGRQQRLGQLLTKVDQAGEKPLSAFGSSVTTPINRGAEGLTPTSVEPPAELLDRVRQFLPQLAESNASLSTRDEHDLDIENVSEDNPYYIEMNLGLGVFEYGGRGTRSVDETSASSSSSSSSTSEGDSEESDSSSLDSSSENEDDAQVAARPKKPLPRRARQNIEVLSGSEDSPCRRSE